MPFEPVVAVALDLGAVGERVAERFAGRGAQQRLAAAGERHDARRERRGEALDLRTLRAPRDVFGRVLAQGDRAYMDADPGGEREVGESAVVGERVAGRVDRIVEQQEEAVGATDLAAVMAREKVARPAVVRGPDLGGACVAEALDQARAVHHVGEEEGAHGHAKGSRRATVARQGADWNPSSDQLGRPTVAKAITDHSDGKESQRHQASID